MQRRLGHSLSGGSRSGDSSWRDWGLFVLAYAVIVGAILFAHPPVDGIAPAPQTTASAR